MEAEIEIHERYCFKKHPRIALAVFFYCVFVIAIVVLSLVTQPTRPAESVVFRIFTAIAQLYAIFIAWNFFRAAMCRSEKFIVGAVALSLGLGLLKGWSPIPSYAVEMTKLVLDSVALFFAASDLRLAFFRE